LLLRTLDIPLRKKIISNLLLSHLHEYSIVFSVKGLMALLLPFLLDNDEYLFIYLLFYYSK